MGSKIVAEVESLNKKISQIASKRVATETESQLVLKNLRQSIVKYEEKYGISLKGKTFDEIASKVRGEYDRVKKEVEEEYALSSKVVSLIEKGNVKEARVLLEQAELKKQGVTGVTRDEGVKEGSTVEPQEKGKADEPKVGGVTKVIPVEEEEIKTEVDTEAKQEATIVEEENTYVSPDDYEVDEDGFVGYGKSDSEMFKAAEDEGSEEDGFEEDTFSEDGDEFLDDEDSSDFDSDDDSDDNFDFDGDFGFGEFLGSEKEKSKTSEKKEEVKNSSSEDPISLDDAFSFDDEDDDGSSFGFGKMLEGSKFEV